MVDTRGFPTRSVPSTARELQSFVRKHQAEWPADLKIKAERALLSLKAIDQHAVRETPSLAAPFKADIRIFAEAYAAWRA